MAEHKATASALRAFTEQRCPRCRSGKVFMHSTYSIRFMDMNVHCPVCGLRFEIEPGFFYGSMYVSYVFTIIGVIAASFITYFLLHDPPVWQYILIISLIFIILSPAIFRFSRLIMLYAFASVRYDPKAGYKKNSRL